MARAMSRSEDRILWMEKGTRDKTMAVKSTFLLLITLIVLFLIGGSLFYVWSRIQVIRLGYEISEALKKGKVLTETSKKLRVEVATLKSYARIEKIAVEQLRMTQPRPDQVIVIR